MIYFGAVVVEAGLDRTFMGRGDRCWGAAAPACLQSHAAKCRKPLLARDPWRSHIPHAPNNPHTIMAKGNNAHKKEVKKPKKEKPKPAPAGRKS